MLKSRENDVLYFELRKIMLEYHNFSYGMFDYNFNWEICYAFLEFVFRILRNLIIRIIMIIMHSSFASEILVAKLFGAYTNGQIVLKCGRAILSIYQTRDNRFRESIGLITSGIRVACNRNTTVD